MHDYIELYKSIQDYTGPYMNMQDYISIQDLTGLCRTIENYRGMYYTQLYWTLYDCTGLYSTIKTTQVYKGPYKTIQEFTGIYRAL